MDNLTAEQMEYLRTREFELWLEYTNDIIKDEVLDLLKTIVKI